LLSVSRRRTKGTEEEARERAREREREREIEREREEEGHSRAERAQVVFCRKFSARKLRTYFLFAVI
jgi:hypothetical protein